jgi:hypothetical protein
MTSPARDIALDYLATIQGATVPLWASILPRRDVEALWQHQGMRPHLRLIPATWAQMARGEVEPPFNLGCAAHLEGRLSPARIAHAGYSAWRQPANSVEAALEMQIVGVCAYLDLPGDAQLSIPGLLGTDLSLRGRSGLDLAIRLNTDTPGVRDAVVEALWLPHLATAGWLGRLLSRASTIWAGNNPMNGADARLIGERLIAMEKA